MNYRNTVTNNGYDPIGPVRISAGFTDCTLQIESVIGSDHSGKWTCYLSKRQIKPARELWEEATNFDVKIFTPATMKFYVTNPNINETESLMKERNMVCIMQKQKLLYHHLSDTYCNSSDKHFRTLHFVYFIKLVLDNRSQIQCHLNGGYPEVSNLSVVIKEKDETCVYSDGANDCFNIIRDLQVK